MPQPPRPFLNNTTPRNNRQDNNIFLRSALSLQEACEARGVGQHVELLASDALITRARARLAARFLAHPQATHLFFVDADIGFAPETVFRLLDAEKALVGGVAPL